MYLLEGTKIMINPKMRNTNKIQPITPRHIVKSILVWKYFCIQKDILQKKCSTWKAKIVRKKTMSVVMPAAMMTDSVV